MGTSAQPPALPWQRAPPVAGAGAHQSVQVAPSRERGPAGSGGGGGGLGGLALVRPSPRASAPGRPAPRAYLRGSRPPRDHRPRQGHLSGAAPLPGPPPGSPRLPGRPDALPGDAVSPRTPSVPRGVPGNAGPRPSPAPPRPCLWELSGGALGLARCPAGPRRCHPPRAGTATPHSPLCPPPPVGTWPHDSSPAPGGAGSAGLRPPRPWEARPRRSRAP